jgi:hypothetical protein
MNLKKTSRASMCAASILGLAATIAHAGVTTQSYAVSGLAAVHAHPDTTRPVYETCSFFACRVFYSGSATRVDVYQSTPFQAFNTDQGVLFAVRASYDGHIYLSSTVKRTDNAPGSYILDYQSVTATLELNGRQVGQDTKSGLDQVGIGTDRAISGLINPAVDVYDSFFGFYLGEDISSFTGTGTRTLNAKLSITEEVIDYPPYYGEGVFQANLSGVISYYWLQHSAPSFANQSSQNAITLDFGDIVQGSPVAAQFGEIFNNALSDGASMGLSAAPAVLENNEGLFAIGVAPGGINAGGGKSTFSLSFNPDGGLGLHRYHAKLTFIDQVYGGVGQKSTVLDVFATANVIASVPEPEPLALSMGGLVVVFAGKKFRSLRRRFQKG